MDILGTIQGRCDDMSQPHTKIGGCADSEGTARTLFFTNNDTLFDADGELFEKELSEGVYKSGAGRVIPVNNLIDVANDGGDLNVSQKGWGPPMPIGLNSFRQNYVIRVGVDCLFKQLSKMNKRSLRVIRLDEKSIAYRTAITSSGKLKTRGFALDSVYVELIEATASDPAEIHLSLFYSANYEKEKINKHSTFVNDEIEGLTGVFLEMGSAAGKAKVRVVCSGDDITSIHGSKFATATLYQNPTGGNPTTVAYANGELTFTPVGKYRILDAAKLKTALIEGLEGENMYTDLA